MKHFIILIIISLALFSSCNKCDESSPGDCKKCYERLEGDWTLNYLATNGVDSVDYYDSLFATNCIMTILEYDKHSDGIEFGIDWGSYSANYLFQGGSFSRIDENGNLVIYHYGSPNTNLSSYPFSSWLPLPPDAFISWGIIMLSDNELWFELDSNGNNYEMHLSKVV